ncbi:4461_t:CDS:1, partial [Racocetra persica]
NKSSNFYNGSPGPPLCRVREIFDFQIPYTSSDEISTLYFTHSLWKIQLGLRNTSSMIDNICEEIQRQRQRPLINPPDVPAELSI